MEDLYTRAWCLVEYIYVTWQAEKAPMDENKRCSPPQKKNRKKRVSHLAILP